MNRVRLNFFFCSVALMLFAGVLHWAPWAVVYKAPFMLISYGVLFLGFIGAWLSFPDGMRTVVKIGLILLVSLLVRIAMTGMQESDDVYRYLWEGKLVGAGESPYQYPADHAHYSAYRDSFWDGMNHKDKLTAYPPLAELIFAGVSNLAYQPWAFKVLFIVADLGVIGLLIAFLKHYELDMRNVLLYAFNPLTLFAFAGEAHFDVLLVLAMMLSLWFADKQKFSWAWFWLGIAIQIKIIAVVLLPMYLLRCQWQKSWVLLIPLVLPSLLFIQTLPGLFQGIWNFGGLNTFNAPAHGSISYLLDGSISTATCLAIIFLALIICWITWKVKPLTKAAYLSMAALVVFLPVVHYWYILWVIPFVVLFPSVSWVVLSFTSGAYFFSIFSVEQGGGWVLPVWAMWVIWLPFLLIVIYELCVMFFRKYRPDANWGMSRTLAVIVPSLNEETHIEACLSSLKSMQPPPDEIIVCDGGSTDRTVLIAQAMGVRIVHSDAGRGNQISAGVEVIRSDVVLVIHADSICDSAVGQRILNTLERNPDVVGGAVGQRFSTFNSKLLIIEMLNDARATLCGTSFGDQGQFFRVAAIQQMGGVPRYPLMEDVELSLRMKRAGRVLLLEGGIHNSARQWKNDFFKRMLLVLKLVFIFHLNRFLQRDVTQKLYARYYNRK